MIGKLGRIGVAPCGHIGERVTANFVTCSAGCDSPPEASVANKTCPMCKSDNIERFTLNDGWHCWPCGGVWS